MPGFVSFSLALAGLVFGLIRSQAEGWGSLQVLGSLIAAVVLLVAFVVIELRVREPMLDLKLLRVPTFNGGLVAAWAVSASIFSLFTYLVIYLQDLLGYSAMAAGLRFLPLTGGVFLVAGIAGRLTTKVPIRLLIGVGFALRGRRTAADARTHRHRTPGPTSCRASSSRGIGAGLINVPLASTAVGVVPPERAGMASGINSTLRQVGIATGVAAPRHDPREQDQVGGGLAPRRNAAGCARASRSALRSAPAALARRCRSVPHQLRGLIAARRQGQLRRRAQHDPARRLRASPSSAWSSRFSRSASATSTSRRWRRDRRATGRSRIGQRASTLPRLAPPIAAKAPAC